MKLHLDCIVLFENGGKPEYVYRMFVCVLCVLQVWEGRGVVKTGRVMLGATNPADSSPGTIRGDYCIEVGRYVSRQYTLVSYHNRKSGACIDTSTDYSNVYEYTLYSGGDVLRSRLCIGSLVMGLL